MKAASTSGPVDEVIARARAAGRGPSSPTPTTFRTAATGKAFRSPIACGTPQPLSDADERRLAAAPRHASASSRRPRSSGHRRQGPRRLERPHHRRPRRRRRRASTAPTGSISPIRAFRFVVTDHDARRPPRPFTGAPANRVFPGLATDYAAMIKAALALHAATFDPAWLDRGRSARRHAPPSSLGRRAPRLFPLRRRCRSSHHPPALGDRRRHPIGRVAHGRQSHPPLAPHRPRHLSRRCRRAPRGRRPRHRRQSPRHHRPAQRSRSPHRRHRRRHRRTRYFAG